MTTHGGYTLALGNNPAFYDEVVNAPWGTVWTEGQQTWIDAEQALMREKFVEGEIAQDRFHRDRAILTMRSRPVDFAKACWLRLRRFWWPLPLVPTDQPPWAVQAAAGVTALTYALALFGIGRAMWNRAGWLDLVLAGPIAFTLVHLVYWSNARMRLPVEPCLCILAAYGVTWRLRQ